MNITVREISSLEPYMDYPCHNGLRIKARLELRDYEDLLACICEQMGDDAFFTYVEKLKDAPAKNCGSVSHVVQQERAKMAEVSEVQGL